MKKYLKYIIGGICLIALILGIGLVIVLNLKKKLEKSYTELKFNDKNAYDSLKNVNYASQYNYDDSKMIINIDIQTKDMTKTSNGDDLELKYEEYKAELTKNGFSCK